MIASIQNYYNAPSPCLDLCVPLQKYQEICIRQNAELTGVSKIAFTISWIVTGIFAYPIFGFLAAIGVAIKAATCQELAVELPAELDPVHMTDEQLQVWGQNSSTTTQLWNDVQLKRLKCFIDESICFAGPSAILPGSFLIDFLQADEHFCIGPVTQQNPLDEENSVYDNRLWLRDVDGSSEEAKAAAEVLLNEVTEGLSKSTADGKRIEIRYVSQVGGDADPHNQGMAYVRCYWQMAPSVSSIGAVDPIDMTPEQLQVWGQGDSVTTADWNEIQMQRFVRVFDEGVELAGEGKLMTSPIYQGPVTLQYPWAIGGPWAGEALYNQYDWCSLSGANASPRDIAEVKQGVVQMLNEATEQGKRVELRSMYRVGGSLDQDNGGIIYINCRTIH